MISDTRRKCSTLNSDFQSNIKVAVRVRPSRERTPNELPLFQAGQNATEFIDTVRATSYQFDRVFTADTPTEYVFNDIAAPIVDSCVQGFNGTIFAYGQTASGKTYTMLGEPGGAGVIQLSVKRLFDRIEGLSARREFHVYIDYLEVYNEKVIDLIAASEASTNADPSSRPPSSCLLPPPRQGCSRPPVRIVENRDGIVETPGAMSIEVRDVAEVVRLLRRCERLRHVSDTAMNERSSRSHTIVSLRVTSRGRELGDDDIEEDEENEELSTHLPPPLPGKNDSTRRPSDAQSEMPPLDSDRSMDPANASSTLRGRSRSMLFSRCRSNSVSGVLPTRRVGETKEAPKDALRVGTLHLVDLAGSEAISRAQTEGLKKLEGSRINQSLLALTRVIAQIAARQQKTMTDKDDGSTKGHINYRDSKLTRLLSNSLGGNSMTSVICCVSAEGADYRETLSTLEFASRARCVRNKAKINMIAIAAEERARLSQLERENNALRDELFKVRLELLDTKEQLPTPQLPSSAELPTPPPYIVNLREQVAEEATDLSLSAKRRRTSTESEGREPNLLPNLLGTVSRGHAKSSWARQSTVILQLRGRDCQGRELQVEGNLSQSERLLAKESSSCVVIAPDCTPDELPTLRQRLADVEERAYDTESRLLGELSEAEARTKKADREVKRLVDLADRLQAEAAQLSFTESQNVALLKDLAEVKDDKITLENEIETLKIRASEREAQARAEKAKLQGQVAELQKQLSVERSAALVRAAEFEKERANSRRMKIEMEANERKLDEAVKEVAAEKQRGVRLEIQLATLQTREERFVEQLASFELYTNSLTQLRELDVGLLMTCREEGARAVEDYSRLRRELEKKDDLLAAAEAKVKLLANAVERYKRARRSEMVLHDMDQGLLVWEQQHLDLLLRLCFQSFLQLPEPEAEFEGREYEVQEEAGEVTPVFLSSPAKRDINICETMGREFAEGAEAVAFFLGLEVERLREETGSWEEAKKKSERETEEVREFYVSQIAQMEAATEKTLSEYKQIVLRCYTDPASKEGRELKDAAVGTEVDFCPTRVLDKAPDPSPGKSGEKIEVKRQSLPADDQVAQLHSLVERQASQLEEQAERIMTLTKELCKLRESGSQRRRNGVAQIDSLSQEIEKMKEDKSDLERRVRELTEELETLKRDSTAKAAAAVPAIPGRTRLIPRSVMRSSSSRRS